MPLAGNAVTNSKKQVKISRELVIIPEVSEEGTPFIYFGCGYAKISRTRISTAGPE
jgi:hypothetical protein